MESQILPVAVVHAPPPQHQVDTRPTADVAALVRDPRPEVPMPMPASIAQKGAVAQAQIAGTAAPVAAVERVLKPYGVMMLPDAPTEGAPRTVAGNEEDASDAPQDAATAADATDGTDPAAVAGETDDRADGA